MRPKIGGYPHTVLMLCAYIDETGNDPNEPVFCFCGWVANSDEWERFSDAWAKQLQCEPAIEYFKHHEAKARIKQFQDWSAADCEKKIFSLAEVITRFDISYGVCTSIRNDVVRRFMRQAIPSPKTVRSILHFSRPYDWCFHSVIQMVLQLQADCGKADQVEFVFDEGDSAFEDCLKLYNEVKERLSIERRNVAGSVRTGNDKELMPLQAADLLAGVSTVRLRGQARTGAAYRLLARSKRIFFSPVNRYETPFPKVEEAVSALNVLWSTKMLESSKQKT